MLDTIKNTAIKAFNNLIQPNGNHLTPIAQLTINGEPFGTQTTQRIISIELTDKRGFEADELTIELNDYDSAIAIPNIGDKITLAIGYQQTGVVYKGEYLFTEFTHQGSPDTLSITARAADLAETLMEQQEKSWHRQTLYQIVATIAQRHQYPYTIADQYKNIHIAHIDQTDESDASFLTRLAEQHDAIATIKNNTLLFIPAGAAQTASGKALPELNITRQSGDNHSFSYDASNAYNAVRAYYTDKKTGQKKSIIINKDNLHPEKQTITQTTTYKKPKKDKKTGKLIKNKTTTKTIKATRKINTEGLKIKTLRNLFASEAGAASGARTAFKKLMRGMAKFDITLAIGRPDLYPETPVTVQGFKAEIDNEKWLINEISHKLDNNGYTCAIKLEARISIDNN